MEPRKIRVGLIVRWPTGGIRTHLKYLYRYLPPGKYAPTLIAPGGEETDYLCENLRHADLTPIIVRGGMKEFAQKVWGLLLRKQVDVVHTHGFTSVGIAALPARLARVPHLATIHDVVTPATRERLGALGLRALSGTLALANCVQAVGVDACRNLETLPRAPLLPHSRLITIRNGVDLVQFGNVAPRPFKRDLGLSEDTFLIGFFGRFMAQKGFRVLVSAIQKIVAAGTAPRPLRVVAVGEGGYMREDQAEIERLGLTDYFRFLPPIENPAPSIAGLDCLVMPSRWEALSILAMEVLCLGTPLIATDCIGLRELTEASAARTVPVDDVQALADALLAEMTTSSRAASEAFAIEARRSFDVVPRVREIDATLEQLIDRRPVLLAAEGRR
jgi:glycosyltransferase involved in cell wall biosynthesis